MAAKTKKKTSKAKATKKVTKKKSTAKKVTKTKKIATKKTSSKKKQSKTNQKAVKASAGKASNKKVAAFSLESTGDQVLSLKDFKGQRIVLYFYPKDSTPGCTTEGGDFNRALSKFKKLNTVILGVSRDSVKSHENFKKKQGYKFDLLSDPEEVLCRQFDVIKEKKLYGRTFMGIERSTFFIDENHKLRFEWRKVKVPGHVDEVLKFVNEFDKS